jgi:hypothetical protein
MSTNSWDPRLVAFVRAVGIAVIGAVIGWVTAAQQDASFAAILAKYAWAVPVILGLLRAAEGWLDKWKGQPRQKPFGGGPAVPPG